MPVQPGVFNPNSRRPRNSSSSGDNNTPAKKQSRPNKVTPPTDQQGKCVNPQARKQAQSMSDKHNLDMDSLMARFDKLEKSNATIQETVTNNAKVISDFQRQLNDLPSDVKKISSDIVSLKIENNQLKHEVAVLQNKHTRLEATVSKLNECVTDIQCRQMRQNLIIRNIDEQPHENVYAAVDKFLAERLRIPTDDIRAQDNPLGFVRIDIAHRIGQYTQGQTRPIVVYFETRSAKEYVMSFAKNLKDTSYSISEQYPDTIRARRAAQMNELKSAKEDGKKVKMVVDKLYTNNELVNPCFSRNALPNICTNIPITLPEIHSTHQQTERGSNFIAYSSHVSSVEEANAALQAIQGLQNMGSVTHLSYAYSVSDENITGHDDDGEYGLSRKIAKAISQSDKKDCLIAVARWHKGPNLGPRRFTIATDCAIQALSLLDS